jgi:hypothetical protein
LRTIWTMSSKVRSENARTSSELSCCMITRSGQVRGSGQEQGSAGRSVEQGSGESGPSRRRTISSNEIEPGARSRVYPPWAPRLLPRRPAFLSASRICSRYLSGMFCRWLISSIVQERGSKAMTPSARSAYSAFLEIRMGGFQGAGRFQAGSGGLDLCQGVACS